MILEEAWNPNFKSQGDIIRKKDNVTLDELKMMKYFFENAVNPLTNLKIGDNGISGELNRVGKILSFSYYYRPNEESEDEPGWIGMFRIYEPLEKPIKAVGQFMSPGQFVECVDSTLETIGTIFFTHKMRERCKREMYQLAIESPRRGTEAGKKYGL